MVFRAATPVGNVFETLLDDLRLDGVEVNGYGIRDAGGRDRKSNEVEVVSPHGERN